MSTKIEKSISKETDVFYNFLVSKKEYIHYHVNMDNIKAIIAVDVKLKDVDNVKLMLEYELKYNNSTVSYKYDEKEISITKTEEVKKTMDEWIKSYEQYSDSFVTNLINFVEQISQ